MEFKKDMSECLVFVKRCPFCEEIKKIALIQSDDDQYIFSCICKDCFDKLWDKKDGGSS